MSLQDGLPPRHRAKLTGTAGGFSEGVRGFRGTPACLPPAPGQAAKRLRGASIICSPGSWQPQASLRGLPGPSSPVPLHE